MVTGCQKQARFVYYYDCALNQTWFSFISYYRIDASLIKSSPTSIFAQWNVVSVDDDDIDIDWEYYVATFHTGANYIAGWYFKQSVNTEYFSV